MRIADPDARRSAAHLQPVDPRQADIEHRHVVFVHRRQAHGILARRRYINGKAGLSQVRRGRFGDSCVVFNEQESHSGGPGAG
jgi:hypothetical protein